MWVLGPGENHLLVRRVGAPVKAMWRGAGRHRDSLLGGSWVGISRVRSPLIWLIILATLRINLAYNYP